MGTIKLSAALKQRGNSETPILEGLQDVMPYVSYPSDKKDPKESSGGSKQHLSQYVQSLEDQIEHLGKLHEAIQAKNMTPVTIGGVTRTVQGWIRYRVHELPLHIKTLEALKIRARQAREASYVAPRTTAIKRGTEVATASIEAVINVDEEMLVEKIKKLKQLQLDLNQELSDFNTENMVEV